MDTVEKKSTWMCSLHNWVKLHVEYHISHWHCFVKVVITPLWSWRRAFYRSLSLYSCVCLCCSNRLIYWYSDYYSFKSYPCTWSAHLRPDVTLTVMTETYLRFCATLHVASNQKPHYFFIRCNHLQWYTLHDINMVAILPYHLITFATDFNICTTIFIMRCWHCPVIMLLWWWLLYLSWHCILL